MGQEETFAWVSSLHDLYSTATFSTQCYATVALVQATPFTLLSIVVRQVWIAHWPSALYNSFMRDLVKKKGNQKPPTLA